MVLSNDYHANSNLRIKTKHYSSSFNDVLLPVTSQMMVLLCFVQTHCDQFTSKSFPTKLLAFEVIQNYD